MQDTPSAKLLELARTQGVLRTRDLLERGIPRVYLTRLVDRGRLLRIGRGLYRLREVPETDHHRLAEAGRRVAGGVVCLLSALAFHRMTPQSPQEVWMAIGKEAWKPTIDQPRLRIVRMSGKMSVEGLEVHLIEGVGVLVTNPAKTVADCFRFRNKIGVEVAIAALRAYHRGHHGTMDELMHYARIDRVANVMRPYLESLE